MYTFVEFSACSGLLVFAAAAAPTGPFLSWQSIVSDFGFPTALVAFLLWAFWKREERSEKNSIERENRIAARVTTLETFQQNELMAMNKQNIQAIGDITAVLNRLVTALGDRPCLCEEKGLLLRLEEITDKMDKLAGAEG